MALTPRAGTSWVARKRRGVVVLTCINVGVAAVALWGVFTLVSTFAAGLVSWAAFCLVAAAPLAALGLILAVVPPRQMFAAGVNGVLAIIFYILWYLLLGA